MASTQFKAGQSGNPSGRPKGARSRAMLALDQLGEENAQAIAEAVIAKAKEGDMMAAKPILDRVWPARKGAPVTFNVPVVAKAEDLPEAIGAVVQQVASGEITPDEGALIVGLLESQRKAIETSELAQRLAALEERMTRP